MVHTLNKYEFKTTRVKQERQGSVRSLGV